MAINFKIANIRRDNKMMIKYFSLDYRVTNMEDITAKKEGMEDIGVLIKCTFINKNY